MISFMRTLGIGAVAGFLLGVILMAVLHRPKPIPIKPDVPHPQVVLPGGKVEVEEKQPVKELPNVSGLPKNQHTVRHIEVDVAVDPVKPPVPSTNPTDNPPLPQREVKVLLDLVRQTDGHLRVVASAEGGKVVGAIDIPVESAPITAPEPGPKPPKLILPTKWSAGAVYGATAWGDSSKGVYIDRDVLRYLRVGGEVTKNSYSGLSRNGWEFRVKLGINF